MTGIVKLKMGLGGEVTRHRYTFLRWLRTKGDNGAGRKGVGVTISMGTRGSGARSLKIRNK